MIEAMENYNKRGSNWIFKKAIRLEVNFVRWKPFEWIWVDSYAGEISAEKSDYQHQKHG